VAKVELPRPLRAGVAALPTRIHANVRLRAIRQLPNWEKSKNRFHRGCVRQSRCLVPINQMAIKRITTHFAIGDDFNARALLSGNSFADSAVFDLFEGCI
jgi:hypothetical protein